MKSDFGDVVIKVSGHYPMLERLGNSIIWSQKTVAALLEQAHPARK
jgi:hypothetical protein